MSARAGAHVLVVDDELAIRRLVGAALRRDGHEVEEAATGAEALAAAARGPALVLLDLGLPDRDGLELIGPLRAAGASVIALTARDASAEKVAALDLGADDYVTKPFDTDELLARARAGLRRRAEARGERRRLAVGEVEVDLERRAVRRAGEEVRLTPKEFALLSTLATHAGRVITHAQLLREVWGPAHETDVEYLRVAVRALRRKLESDPSDPRLLRNEPGVGYRMAEPD